jgi:hypothetical protein
MRLRYADDQLGISCSARAAYSSACVSCPASRGRDGCAIPGAFAWTRSRYRLDEDFSVGAEPVMRDAHGIACRQRFQALRQVIGRRHLGAANQDGDDPLVLIQPSLDLQPYEVTRIIEAPGAVRIRCGQPTAADDRQQDVALGDTVIQDLNEVESGLDAVHVEEQPILGKCRFEHIEQATRRPSLVAAPIADEDLSGHVWRQRWNERCERDEVPGGEARLNYPVAQAGGQPPVEDGSTDLRAPAGRDDLHLRAGTIGELDR